MKAGDLCIVNTTESHITSHLNEIVVVKRVSGKKVWDLVRAFNLNRQEVHDYWRHQLTKVKQEGKK